VIIALDAPSAFSAGSPCDVITPTNFQKLTLDKKIQVSEAIRDCERKLVQKPKESNTKSVGSPEKDARTSTYISALANRPAY
jgi:hypothetical protein